MARPRKGDEAEAAREAERAAKAPPAESFAELFGGAKRDAPGAGRGVVAKAPQRRASAKPAVAPAPFSVQREGERLAGLASGVDRSQLRRLRRGEHPPEQRIDLHGLAAAPARRALRTALARALADGLRCLLVIHGRGLHSEGAPLLREALPEWLAEPPHGASVLAFSSARPEHGGGGACYVLLRRRRRMLGA